LAKVAAAVAASCWANHFTPETLRALKRQLFNVIYRTWSPTLT
jgi:hypothetical protein